MADIYMYINICNWFDTDVETADVQDIDNDIEDVPTHFAGSQLRQLRDVSCNRTPRPPPPSHWRRFPGEMSPKNFKMSQKLALLKFEVILLEDLAQMGFLQWDGEIRIIAWINWSRGWPILWLIHKNSTGWFFHWYAPTKFQAQKS